MFLRDMRHLKKILCSLIDSEGPYWTRKFTYLIDRYTYLPDKDAFVGYILLHVDEGRHIQAKALVRSTIDDVALRPWIYHLVLFLAFPYHVVQYIYRKITT